VDDEGRFLITSLKESKALVKGLKNRYDKDGSLIGNEITFHDPLTALKMMGDMQGWNAPQKVELGFAGGLGPDILKQVDEVTIDAEVVEDNADERRKLLE